MKQNLGKLDRIFRFVLGSWWISQWAPAFPSTTINWLIFIIGWWALAESFIGWCGLHNVLKINNKIQ